MKKFVLASQSPRRQELLGILGIPFEVIVSDTEEVITQTDPAKVTEELSAQKAGAVADQVEESIIIGADTVVSIEGRILGKPEDEEAAYEMINSLQGKSHMVYTGVTIIVKGKEIEHIHTFSEGTKVKVSKMSEKEIYEYIHTEEPYDKAGAYGIQGMFGKFIKGIEGDYYNVVGLPINHLYEELKKIEGSPCYRLIACTKN